MGAAENKSDKGTNFIVRVSHIATRSPLAVAINAVLRGEKEKIRKQLEKYQQQKKKNNNNNKKQNKKNKKKNNNNNKKNKTIHTYMTESEANGGTRLTPRETPISGEGKRVRRGRMSQ